MVRPKNGWNPAERDENESKLDIQCLMDFSTFLDLLMIFTLGLNRMNEGKYDIAYNNFTRVDNIMKGVNAEKTKQYLFLQKK